MSIAQVANLCHHKLIIDRDRIAGTPLRSVPTYVIRLYKSVMPTELHISDEWKDALASVGLDTFDALMGSSQGKCVSWHTRGQTYRIDLPDGRVVFLKRDAFTSVKDIFTDLCSLRYPQPPCINEVRALRLVADLGIPAPEPVAWGQRRRASLPWRAAMVMQELPGVPMYEFLAAGPSEDRRRSVMQAAGSVAAKLHEARLSWPDMAPKHFIINAGNVGILDLARLRPARRPRRFYAPKQVRRFGARLRNCGGSDGDLTAFLDALRK